MQKQMHEGYQDQARALRTADGHDGVFLFVAMYILMYAMVNRFDNVFAASNQFSWLD